MKRNLCGAVFDDFLDFDCEFCLALVRELDLFFYGVISPPALVGETFFEPCGVFL